MRAAIATTLMAVTACTSLTGIPTSTTLPQPVTSTLPDQPVDPSLGCPLSVEFAGEGRVLRIDQPESDTAIVGLISWTETTGCESFQIDFQTVEGAPSTTPPSTMVEFLDSRQVIRIHLSASSTIITDQIVETDLVERLYVVRSLTGGMFVDLHLRQPAQARARVVNSPARLLLDLQPGVTPFTSSAAISERAIVTNPVDGSDGAMNIEVSGYARTFEASVLIIATSSGQVVAETATQAADWTETWGEFKTRIDLPLGRTSIFVGEQNPEDGSLSGVTVNVTAS